MQSMQEPSPAEERSRRRPPRRRSEDPVPLPQGRNRGRRNKVKLQDVLKAYQRALVELLEARMATASQAAAEGARRAVEQALADRPRGPEESDVARGVLASADERFQAVGVRLEQIEDVLRTLAGQGPAAPAPAATDERLASRIEGITAAVTRLAEEQGKLVDALGQRTGHGIVAVARVIRDDLERLGQDVATLGQRIDALETSVRSLHRTVAWEGMRTPRPGGPAPE
jgi:hypothetical protein